MAGQARLAKRLYAAFGERVLVEGSIHVDPVDDPTSEPEPDLMVLRRPTRGSDPNPGPAEILWLIELSDTTLAFDLNVKARLYARAGIQDYWVFDLGGRRIIIHRDPRDGAYTWIVAHGEEDSVSPLMEPSFTARVADLLPD
jgi:hypothetical protein